MRGRWGGRRGSGSFRYFVYKFWDKVSLSDYKTVTSKSDLMGDTKTIEDVDYTEMSGIWDINTTTQFKKKPPAGTFSDVSFGSQIFGRTGPDLTQATNAMLGTDSPQPITVVNGIQYWVVPATGTYRILAHGAKGGSASHSYGGQGASIQGDFTLTQGETIMILVGQQPDPVQYSDFDSPGGGGTFVVKGTNPSSATTSDILVIAGGGGGSDANNYGTPSSASGQGVTANSGGLGVPNTSTAGSNGLGGNNSVNQTVQSGAGFDGDSLISNPGTTTHIAAKSFKNGGVGGDARYGSGIGGEGGFGGGGGCGRNGNFGPMGGGGGYSGGASGYNSYTGGGGGSYNNGSNQVNTNGGSPFNGNGRVYVTKIG